MPRRPLSRRVKWGEVAKGFPVEGDEGGKGALICGHLGSDECVEGESWNLCVCVFVCANGCASESVSICIYINACASMCTHTKRPRGYKNLYINHMIIPDPLKYMS